MANVVVKRTPWQIQRSVVFALLMREIRTRFGKHWSGVVWVLGQPFGQLALLIGVNHLMQGALSRSTFPYPVFLLAAYVPFHTCMGLWTQLPAALSANRGLFNYRQVKPFDAMVSRVILEVVIDLIVMALLLFAFDWIGYEHVLPDDPLAYFALFGLSVLLGTGVGFVLAAFVGLMPRLTSVVQLLSFPLYMASGVLVSMHHFSQEVLDWLLLNPMLHLVELTRAAYLPGYVPLQGVNWAFPGATTLVLLTLGMSLYRVRRRRMASGQ